MTTKTHFLRGFLAIALLAVSAFGVQAADTLKARYSWKLKGEYAAFYVAKEKGLFDAAGLDVALGEGGGAQAALGALLQGQEDVVIMPAVFALTAITGGMPIKVIALYHPSTPLGILSFENKPVRTPKDLEGKTIAVTVGDTVAAYLPVLCKINHVDCSKIDRVQMDSQVRTSQFMTHKVDMMSTYLNVDLPILETKTDGLVAMDLTKYGLDLPGLSIVTSDKKIAAQPDLLSRFLGAVGKAIPMAKNNLDEATSAMLANWPVAPERGVVRRQIEETMERIPEADGKPVGWVDPAHLEKALSLLESVGEIKDPKPVDAYYTNALLKK